MGKLLSLFDREPAPSPGARRTRPYQADAIKAALSGLTRVRSGLCVLPTGTGKTVVAADIARQWEGRVARQVPVREAQSVRSLAIRVVDREASSNNSSPTRCLRRR